MSRKSLFILYCIILKLGYRASFKERGLVCIIRDVIRFEDSRGSI